MLGLNKLTLVAMALCSATSMTKQKKKSKQSNPGNSKRTVFIGSMAAIVFTVLIACCLSSASAESTVSDRNLISAISNAADDGSKEQYKNVQADHLMTVDNFWVKHTGKEGGFFCCGRDGTVLTRFLIDFISMVNAQAGRISPGVNTIFQSEDGNFEFIYGEYIDSPFIIRMQDGKELVAKIMKKTFESTKEANQSKDKFFNFIRDIKNLNGFIMGAKDSNIVYYWATMDANYQPLSGHVSSDNNEVDSNSLIEFYKLFYATRHQAGLPIRPLTDRNEVNTAYMYVDMFSILFDRSPNVEWKAVEYIGGEQRDINNQNLVRLSYNCKMLGSNIACVDKPSIEVNKEEIEAVGDIEIPRFSKYIRDFHNFAKRMEDALRSNNTLSNEEPTTNHY